MRGLKIFVLFAFLLVATRFAVAAEMRVGIVDIQEVLESVEEGKRAKNQLEKAILDRKQELEKRQKDYKKMEEEFEKQKLILSPAAVGDKQRELDVKKTELQKAFVGAQADMQKKEMELTGDILKKIKAVVGKIGQEGSYDVVWEKNEGGIVYSKGSFDVTKQVIEQYNKSYVK